jgi:hypothetical protein
VVEFVRGLKANDMIGFEALLRGFDLGHIQSIIGRTSVQERLHHAIDALPAEGKRWCQPPPARHGLARDVRSV